MAFIIFFFFWKSLKKLKKLELSPQNFRYDVLHLLYSGATDIYLLSSWKVSIAENPIAIMGLYICLGQGPCYVKKFAWLYKKKIAVFCEEFVSWHRNGYFKSLKFELVFIVNFILLKLYLFLILNLWVRNSTTYLTKNMYTHTKKEETMVKIESHRYVITRRGIVT